MLQWPRTMVAVAKIIWALVRCLSRRGVGKKTEKGQIGRQVNSEIL